MKKYRYTNIPSVLQGSIPDGEEVCFLTGRRVPCDFHHIMTGPYRKLSEEYGLWVWLEHNVHMALHGTSAGKAVERDLKAKAQIMFERQHSREMWMKRFHKNYL